MRRVLSWYGASPAHLLSLVAGMALSAYAVSRVTALGTLLAIGVWFVGTLIAHDLVLFPIYAATDNASAWLRHRVRRGSAPSVPAVNYLRVPAVLSGLLLIAWFPLVLRLSPGYERVTGRSDDPYLGRWLLVTGVLFAGSALLYAARLLRVRQQTRESRPSSKSYRNPPTTTPSR